MKIDNSFFAVLPLVFPYFNLAPQKLQEIKPWHYAASLWKVCSLLINVS